MIKFAFVLTFGVSTGFDMYRHREWTLVHLMEKSPGDGKPQDKLDEVVERERMVEEDDLPELKYFNAIVKEALRLHPPASLLP